MTDHIDMSVANVIAHATTEQTVIWRQMAEAAGFDAPVDFLADVLVSELERRVKKVERSLMDAQVEDIPGQQSFPELDLPLIVTADDGDGTTVALPVHQATGAQLESYVTANERRQYVRYKKARSHSESVAKLREQIGEPFESVTVREMDDALNNPITEIP